MSRRVALAVLAVGCIVATVRCTKGDTTGPRLGRVTVVVEQPSVFVAVGDSLLLLVDVLDSTGNPISQAPVTWTARQPATATVAQHGTVTGVHTGQTWVVAQVGDALDSAAVTVTPHLTTTVTPHGDTLTSIGQTATLHAQSADSTGHVIPGSYVWVARDTTVVTVSQTGVVTARHNGLTSVLAIERGGSSDSATLFVAQRVTKLSIAPTRATQPLMRVQQFQVTALDSGGTPVANAHIAWASRVPAVASVDSTGLTTALTVGTDTIVATAGGMHASAVFVATPLPALHFSQDTIGVGVGQEPVVTIPDVIADTAGFDQAFNVTLTVADSTVASLPGATQTINLYTPTNGYFRPIGNRLGTVVVTASAPRWKSATAIIDVTRPRVVINRAPSFAPINPILSNQPATIWVLEEDSRGNINGSTTGMRLAMRTSNAAAIIAQQDTVFATGGGAHFTAVAVGAGQSTLTVNALSSANYATDTITVSAAPAKLLFEDLGDGRISQADVALGQKVVEEGAVNPLYWVDLGCFAHITVQLTITQKHPTRARVSPLSTPVTGGNCGLVRVPLDWTGLQLGADTLIASAPGFQSDTLVLHVTTPFLRLNPPLSGSDSVGAAIPLGLYQADSSGESWDLTAPVPVLITSTDTTIVRMSCDTVVLGASSTPPGCAAANALLVGAGTATINFRDLSGHSAPLASTISVNPGALVIGVDNTAERPVPIGFWQELGPPGHFFAGLPVNQAGAAIHLRSTNPAVAMPSVTDTVPPAYASLVPFDVAAGTVPGTAWIVVSGRGMLSDSIAVTVGQPTFGVFAANTGTTDDSARRRGARNPRSGGTPTLHHTPRGSSTAIVESRNCHARFDVRHDSHWLVRQRSVYRAAVRAGHGRSLGE